MGEGERWKKKCPFLGQMVFRRSREFLQSVYGNILEVFGKLCSICKVWGRRWYQDSFLACLLERRFTFLGQVSWTLHDCQGEGWTSGRLHKWLNGSLYWKPIFLGAILYYSMKSTEHFLDHSYSVKIRKEGADKMICRTSGFQLRASRGWNLGGGGKGVRILPHDAFSCGPLSWGKFWEDNLRMHGKIILDRCCMWKLNRESAKQLFYTAKMAQELWTLVLYLFLDDVEFSRWPFGRMEKGNW